jgi:glycosyltransferase involved in cell wall biosynthesis
MRIGIDARKADDGGIGRYVREILARVPEILPRAEFLVAARVGTAARLRQIAPDARVVEVRARGYSIGEHVELPRVFDEAGCDLVHVPHYVLPLGLRSPVVVTVHDLIHRRLPRSPLHGLYARALLALVRRRAALVLAPSQAVAADLETLVGVARTRIRVVPHGVADAFLAGGPPPPAEIDAFCSQRGLRRPYVLNVTNGLPHKGLDVLLAALAGLPELSLVLGGTGSDRPAVRRKVSAARLHRSPLLLGELSDGELRLAYGGAAVVAAPSRYEGFGLPALEAMAAGAPVVAAAAGGAREVVGDAGVLVPPGSVACLERALYRIAFELHPTEREGLIQRGLIRAGQFPWDRAARATCVAYEQAIAETR